MSEKVEIVATMPVRSRPVTLQWASVNSYNGLLLRHVFVDIDPKSERANQEKLCTPHGWEVYKNLYFETSDVAPHYCSTCLHVLAVLKLNVGDFPPKNK